MATRQDEGGSRLWRGMRHLIFGEEAEPTLREEIEDAIDEAERLLRNAEGRVVVALSGSETTTWRRSSAASRDSATTLARKIVNNYAHDL